MRKPLGKAPPHHSALDVKTPTLYDLRIKYAPGKYTYAADTLFRAYLEVRPNNLLNDELIHVIRILFSSFPITPSKLDEIRTATSNNSALC